MEITIKAKPKEIAALVAKLQERSISGDRFSNYVACCLPEELKCSESSDK